jgi:murein DD-endopeptidase MepM/ murein hydrolase activator NlpD
MTVPGIPVDDVITREPRFVYQTFKAGKGDTLAALLIRAGATAKDAQAAIKAIKKYFNPRKFRKGQKVEVAYQPDSANTAATGAGIGTFHGFSLRPDLTTKASVYKTDQDTFEAELADRPLTTTLARAEGTITSSLYVAGKRAGLPNATLAELIRAYSWDVDFQRDIRKGDAFQVMFEKVTDEDGNLVRSNTIRFATLTLSGKVITAYRFRSSDGNTSYYNEKGLSARKALMRTPIDGARLSSSFGRRKHPILGYTKRHTGVDFAAPRGTPFYAAGNGTVTYAGRKGGYGIYIRIRHNSSYSTAYAHMKGLARGIRNGKRVNQGQIIGYVGSTGRSTGPHLHYEILRDGRPTNPLRVKMPAGKKLNGNDLEKFFRVRDRIDQQFAAIETGATVAALSK